MTDLRLRSLLARVGCCFYGERWQSPLARDLGVSDRSVRAWMAGTRSIPEGIWADLRRLLQERVVESRGLLGELPD